MNKLISRLMMIAILMGAISFTSCEKDADPIDETKILIEYLESTIDPISWMPSVKTAEALYTDNLLDKVYIIDIRSEEDFAKGYIENAVNVAAGNILTHVQGEDLTAYEYICVVCYSGQTAAWASSLLRLSGYDNVYSLKFGMCSWNPEFSGSWNSNVSNTYATDFTKDAASKGAAGNLPKLSTGKTSGEDILAARVNAILAEGFSKAATTNKSVIVDNKDDYYVVNYWSEDHYSNPGHIKGAMQYTPKTSLKQDADLLTLPTDKKVAVYCYTGQTSAYMSAYLRVLGYDAYSIKFGANGMIYDQVPAAKWHAPEAPGYPVVMPGQ